MTDTDTIEMPVEQFRLLTELAGVGRHRTDVPDLYMRSAEKSIAARRAHDTAKNLLREYDNES